MNPVPRRSDSGSSGGKNGEGLVLVTGANGYLGRELSRRFLADGMEVVLAVRSSTARSDVAAALGPLAERARFVAVDLTEAEPFAAVHPALRRRITSVVHGAAVTRFNVDREVAALVNVEGTRHALALARSCPELESFTLVGTVYSSGLQVGRIAEEAHSDEAGFANFYEWSKWEAEQLVLAQADELPWRVLRVATVAADDDTGAVTHHNAFHETLKLCFYGLLALLPGCGDTPLYFVTRAFAVDAVRRLTDPACPGGIYHVAHDRSASITLDQLLDIAFEEFESVDDFRKKRILRPLLADEESFDLMVDGVTGFAGSLVTQALANVAPFARQLYVTKDLDNSRLRSALHDYEAPDAASLVRATCHQLVATRWGRRAAHV